MSIVAPCVGDGCLCVVGVSSCGVVVCVGGSHGVRAPHCGVLWRFPTLPHPLGCSTIGAAGLSFQVRNGAGRFPGAMTTTSLLRPHAPLLWGVGRVGRGSYSGCGTLPPPPPPLPARPHKTGARGEEAKERGGSIPCPPCPPPVGARAARGTGAGGSGRACGIGPLVPVGSRAPRSASTSGLSTR